ncbi:MAG: Methionyl-tRNA formyltransferase [Chlamydiales bacterium]|nr:Methionyl-tRNA formyltransferase [Chlamydiales bacterium]
MKIIFFGTPEIAKRILEQLVAAGQDVIAVVTNPDKAVGRSSKKVSSPVKRFAEESNIPVYQPLKASSLEFSNFLKTLGADIFLVAAYSEILKENVLSIPPKGCVNVHASLLPLYRGAAPIQRAIMAGEKETGVTIMAMNPQLDAGDMLKVKKIAIGEDMTSGELFEQMAKIGGQALVETLPEIEDGTIKPIPQDSHEPTYARKLKSEDGELDFEKSAKEVYNQFRGVTPKPGAFCMVEVNGKRKKMLVKKARRTAQHGQRPGEVLSKTELIVACQEESLNLIEVQLEGKRALNAHDFLKGTPANCLKF